jgi:1-acyl-sn-glycerol-3-phosphate acyltransferase
MGVLSLRKFFGLLRLGWVIFSGMAALRWFLICQGGGEGARIAWMQWMSRRFLALLHARVTVSGSVPSEGLIASNHLSYVDILVIGSLCPAIFVAKSDVNVWPVFGWLCRNAGTIFVSRDNPAEVPAQLATMERPLREGIPVVLFPEGTSSEGSIVLPFRSSLMESTVRSGKPVTPTAISYPLHGNGNPGQEIAYWGDHTLFPHLLNLLSKPGFEARIAFGHSRPPESDRKREATRLHGEVSGLLEQIR